MALKVVSSTPITGLRVTTKPVAYVTPKTVNPQKSVSPQPATYNPQKTATVKQLNNAKVGANWAQEQAQAMRVIEDKRLAESAVTRRRLADAKTAEINTGQSNFAKKLGDKVSFGDLRRQRGGRELAVKYWEENEKVWGSQIIARQRNYESGGAKFKDWVMQAETEEEYNKRVSHANWWLEKEYNEITADIKDFQITQIELANYAETPLKGKLATVGRLGKDTLTGVTGQTWNALTWTASQPQRAVNTIKNFANPNNLRQYYGGEEKKSGQDIVGQGSNPLSTGWNQLKKSYNASKDQRIIATSKESEAKQLKFIEERTNAKWGKQTGVKGFFRNQEVEKARVKYGDDVVDMLLDPLNYFNGVGGLAKANKTKKAVTKTDELMAILGKNKTMRNMILSGEASKEWLKASKIGKFARKMGEEFKPRQTKAYEAVDVLRGDLAETVAEFKGAKNQVYKQFKSEFGIGNKIKSDLLLKQGTHASRLNADLERFKGLQTKLSQDFVKRLDEFSDTEVRAVTKFARNGDWSTVDKMRISKPRRMALLGFLEDYQVKARKLAKSEGLKRVSKSYLPEYTGRGYDPTQGRTVFGKKYFGQGRQQLQESLVQREFISNWDEADSFTKQLSQTEKSILRNAKKTGRDLTILEQQRLSKLGERMQLLDKVKNRYTKKFDAIKGAIATTKQNAQPAFRISRSGIKTNFTKQGFKNSAVDTFHLPMSVWKKSVLKYNPAWYVNNALWNVPASVSASGPGVFTEYTKLLTSKGKYLESIRKTLPEGVMSKITQEIGKGGLASKIEDTARIATFLALKKQGYADDVALKQVNRWLFDYGTKNWERPIKGVLPFWQWQKNIVRLGTTMPFHSPRSAKVYSEAYKHFYKRPYESLPDEDQEYTDPETGKTVKYNPKEFYKGKAKIGDNWYGVPSFAVNPESALQFGTNPYLLSAMDYVTSTDRLGNSNTNRGAWTILGERFPQSNLARAMANRNNKDSDSWFSASGNSKTAQGWDKTKPNYKESLDNNRKFYNTLKSFVGIPRAVKFDRDEFELKKRLTQFNKDFFAVDWAVKEDENYKQAQKEKEELASKYGFDLQKDIYDNYWSKYDTPTTTRTKTLKREASKFNSPDTGWWGDYFKLEKGSINSPSERRPFLIKKFDEWKRDHTFAKNPYYKLPKKGEINPFVLKREENESKVRRTEGKRKYQRKLEYEKATKTGDWSYFNTGAGRTGKTGIEYNGKFFKTAESRDKFIAGNEKYKKGQLWAEYYALRTTKEKQAWLDQHPELRTFKEPTTQKEWDELRALLREQRQAKMRKLTGFEENRANIKRKIQFSLPTKTSKTKKIKYKF